MWLNIDNNKLKFALRKLVSRKPSGIFAYKQYSGAKL